MPKTWLQRTRESCVFCRMVDGRQERPADWVDHGKTVSFTPLDPVTPGHRLFVRKIPSTERAWSWPRPRPGRQR